MPSAGFINESFRIAETRTQEETISAVVDYIRHQAALEPTHNLFISSNHKAGYPRSLKANGARDALYQLADKLEKDWQTIVLPRSAHKKVAEP